MKLHTRVQEYRCDRCGERVHHVEMWEGVESDRQGLPPELRRCHCGGTRALVASFRKGRVRP